MITTPCLTDLVRDYVTSRDISSQYASQLRHQVAAYVEWTGDDSCSAWSETQLSAFLRTIKRSPSTVKGYRGNLLTIWRYCADIGLVDYPQIRRVPRPNVPRRVPSCFTVEEARELLRVASGLRGRNRDGVPRADYWNATIRTAWDTGLRRSDLWRLRSGDVRADGLLPTIGHKTGVLLVHRLTTETVAAMRRIGTPQPLAWCYDQRHFCRYFQAKIVAVASVRKGTFRWLRRASGSYVEALYPGRGAGHLGHTCPATFRKFYDARLVSDLAEVPMPPKL